MGKVGQFNRLQAATLIAFSLSVVLVTLGSLFAQGEYGPFLIVFNMVFQTLFWPLLAAQAAYQRLGTRIATLLAATATFIISMLGLYIVHAASGPGLIDYSWVIELNEIGPGATVKGVLPLITAKIGLSAIIPFIFASLPERAQA